MSAVRKAALVRIEKYGTFAAALAEGTPPELQVLEAEVKDWIAAQ